MYENFILFKPNLAFSSTILNTIFAERIYDRRVSAYGIFVLCLSLLVLHMKCKD